MWPTSDDFLIDEWPQLILAAAHAVMDKEDNAKSRKDQSIDEIVSSDLLLMLEKAQVIRNAFQNANTKRISYIMRFMPTLEASKCLIAASNASQRSKVEKSTDGVCCFTNTNVTKSLVFHCNKDGRHTTTQHDISSGPWSRWIESAMVVGNVQSWLDERVGVELKIGMNNISRQITMDDIVSLQQNVKLQKKRTLFRDACLVLLNITR